ncbi:Methylenetetrahydrofolate--tRNA-(uracil-5-)-methyltransferase [Frankliniella fusca]|uniref:Methylenetetrahydrofolate--tRNA-(Uracil-5-)-methyltransferase n=1 Tax=Frankliniella fusca TaxID=407009 RepID=A0AAE1L6A1_9NEOP|nr:Methylenetetrahydrofolate--tRNA-(uracil-5-)-methyltransferase [Frankliniella fusca]
MLQTEATRPARSPFSNFLCTAVLVLDTPSNPPGTDRERRRQLTRGGVVIYVRNETIAVELDVSNITVERLCECVTVKLKNNTVIMCVYRSPKTSIPNFLNHFNECLGFIVSNSTKAVICGDFNINLLSDNKYSTDFRNLLASYGFDTAINAPTRLGKGCESAIDILVTNYEPKKYSCSTVEVGLSDHTLQCMIIKEKLPPRKKCFTFKRVITSASMKAFCDNLCYVNWECVYRCDNVNVMYDNFIQIFQSLFEKCFKPRKVYLNNQGSLYHVNPRINQLSQQNIAYHKLMKSTSDPVIIQMCKQYRKFYKAEVATMKKKLNENFIENASNKCKAMWSVINKELGRADLTQENIVIQKGDMILTNPVHIANTFNSYYIHSVQSLVSSTPDMNCKFPSQSGSIVFSPLSETEVLNTVLRMKTKSSSGLDGIPSSVVKQSVNFIIKPLTFIINSSFASEPDPAGIPAGLSVKQLLQVDGRVAAAASSPGGAALEPLENAAAAPRRRISPWSSSSHQASAPAPADKSGARQFKLEKCQLIRRVMRRAAAAGRPVSRPGLTGRGRPTQEAVITSMKKRARIALVGVGRRHRAPRGVAQHRGRQRQDDDGLGHGADVTPSSPTCEHARKKNISMTNNIALRGSKISGLSGQQQQEEDSSAPACSAVRSRGHDGEQDEEEEEEDEVDLPRGATRRRLARRHMRRPLEPRTTLDTLQSRWSGARWRIQKYSKRFSPRRLPCLLAVIGVGAVPRCEGGGDGGGGGGGGGGGAGNEFGQTNSSPEANKASGPISVARRAERRARSAERVAGPARRGGVPKEEEDTVTVNPYEFDTWWLQPQPHPLFRQRSCLLKFLENAMHAEPLRRSSAVQNESAAPTSPSANRRAKHDGCERPISEILCNDFALGCTLIFFMSEGALGGSHLCIMRDEVKVAGQEVSWPGPPGPPPARSMDWIRKTIDDMCSTCA